MEMIEFKILVSSFEGYSQEEQIFLMESLLLGNGYVKEEKKGNKGTINRIYTNDTSDYVFVVVTKKGVSKATLIDKDLFVYRIEPIKESIVTYSVCGGKGKDIRFDFWLGSLIKLHRLAYEEELIVGVDLVVDHITHNKGINIREMLRVCTKGQNRINKKFYSKIEGNSFSMPSTLVSEEEKASLISEGYVFKRRRVYSPEFETYEEMCKALNGVEERILGEYRYNPLLDFSETGYAFLVHKLLGIGTMEDVREYNRSYMREHHPDIAQYYAL